MKLEQRYGKFFVTPEMVRDPILSDILAKMKFIPTRVEFIFHSDRFEYTGSSCLFNIVETGCLIPTYQIEISTISTQSGNEISVSAEIIE